MTYPELTFDVTDGHVWTEVMYKDGKPFCLGLFISLLHRIGSCSTLYFFVLLCNYPSRMKTVKWFVYI